MKIAAIVLAAGRSSRMGEPKQLMSMGELTLVGHTLSAVRKSRVSETTVVLGFEAESIRPYISDARVVINEQYAAGMGTSLQCGIRSIDPESNAVLIALADQPLVRTETIDHMIREYQEHQPQILIPTYRGFRGNPVLIDRSVFPEIAGLNGDMGCRALFGSHLKGIRKVEVDDPGILFDADKKEDIKRIRLALIVKGSLDIPLYEAAAPQTPGKPQVVVVGREAVASALAQIAELMGWNCVLVDPLLQPDELPEATGLLHTLDFSHLPASDHRFAVIASLGRFDEEAIQSALHAGISYIALLSSKSRAQEVLRSLSMNGVDEAALRTIRTPAGLPIGAKTPQEIALSIAADIVRELNSRS